METRMAAVYYKAAIVISGAVSYLSVWSFCHFVSVTLSLFGIYCLTERSLVR